MKYAVGMSSGAIVDIPSFITNWFSHSEVDGWDTQTALSVHKPALIIRNKESRLNISVSMRFILIITQFTLAMSCHL
jgi:hypothetical protein